MKKGYVISFIIGGLLFGFISFVSATILYSAKDIEYKDSNVQDAIDDLYTIANERGKRVSIGSSNTTATNTFNVSNLIEDCHNAVLDDFIVSLKGVTVTPNSSSNVNRTGTISYTYNKDTCVFTVPLNYEIWNGWIWYANYNVYYEKGFSLN